MKKTHYKPLALVKIDRLKAHAEYDKVKSQKAINIYKFVENLFYLTEPVYA